MKNLLIILFSFLCISSTIDNNRYSKPYHQKDFIKIYRKYGPLLLTPGFTNCFKADNKGIVFELKDNSPIIAIQDGVVIEICDTCNNSKFGNFVTVKREKALTAKYYHLSIINVKVNQTIKKAQEIGISGNTGLTTVNGVGIQIEKEGKIVDPMKIINCN